jgi:hypothetical protein
VRRWPRRKPRIGKFHKRCRPISRIESSDLVLPTRMTHHHKSANPKGCRNLPGPLGPRPPEFTGRDTPRPTSAPKKTEGHQFYLQARLDDRISHQSGLSRPLDSKPEFTLTETLIRTCQTDLAAIKDSFQRIM